MVFPIIPRRSATLMLAVRVNHLANQQSAQSVRYKLLMLQRSSASRFMPNRYVFPGGVSEPTDFSPEWLDLLGNNGLPLLKPTMSSAPFYETYANQLSRDSLPAHVGFRICAIRETFEESGVLLVKSLQEGDKTRGSTTRVSVTLSDDEVKTWREKVHSDASLFIQLCRDIQCVPDIWSLHEWSNWITPVHRLKRFDTIFYLAFLDNEPEMSHDGKEVTGSMWVNPEECLMLSATKKLNLAPPQFYEMSRICRFLTIDELRLFVMALEGVESWEAVAINSKDGDTIYFFPGDDMYEQVKQNNYKFYENFMKTTATKDLKQKLPLLNIPETTQELSAKTKNMNRIALNLKTSTFRAQFTATLKYNMPTPPSTPDPFPAKL